MKQEKKKLSLKQWILGIIITLFSLSLLCEIGGVHYLAFARYPKPLMIINDKVGHELIRAEDETAADAIIAAMEATLETKHTIAMRIYEPDHSYAQVVTWDRRGVIWQPKDSPMKIKRCDNSIDNGFNLQGWSVVVDQPQIKAELFARTLTGIVGEKKKCKITLGIGRTLLQCESFCGSEIMFRKTGSELPTEGVTFYNLPWPLSWFFKTVVGLPVNP